METSTALDEYNATVWSNATALNVTPTLGAGGGGLAEDGVSTEADRALTICYIIIGTVGIIGKSISFLSFSNSRSQSLHEDQRSTWYVLVRLESACSLNDSVKKM